MRIGVTTPYIRPRCGSRKYPTTEGTGNSKEEGGLRERSLFRAGEGVDDFLTPNSRSL